MREYFYFGSDVGDFLIKGILVKTPLSLVFACLFVGCLAFLFEYLRYMQTRAKQRELKIRAKQIKLLCPTESASLLARTVTNPRNPLNITLLNRMMLFTTEVSLWLSIQNLGYIIMLIVMLYDAWLLMATVIGGVLGYFVFGQKFMKINLENCRIIRDTYCTQICGETDGHCGTANGESTPANTPSTSQNNIQCHNNSNNEEIVVNVHRNCHD